MDIIGTCNNRILPNKTALTLFDWVFSQGDGVIIPGAAGPAATINDGTVSTLDTTSAWANAGYLTTTAGAAKKGAWSEAFTQTACPLDTVRGDTWFLFFRGKWAVPTGGTDLGILGTLNGGSGDRSGWAVKLAHSGQAFAGRGVLNLYHNGGLAGAYAIHGGTVPAWVDGADHSVALAIDGQTGRCRRYVDGVLRIDNTLAAIAGKDYRTNFVPDGTSGHLMIGSTALSIGVATGGGQFRRVLSLYRATMPSDAVVDALVERLHAMPAYVPTRAEWDDA